MSASYAHRPEAAVGHPPVVDHARREDRGRERRQDAETERDRETADRTAPELEENQAREERRDVAVENGAPGALVARFDRGAGTLAEAKLLAQGRACVPGDANHQCSDIVRRLDDAEPSANVAIGSFIAGGLGFGVGIGLLAWTLDERSAARAPKDEAEKPKSATVHVLPVAGPTSYGVVVGGTFE